MSDVIIDRVNANFGYRAISRISLVQTLSTPTQPTSPKPGPQLNQNRHDIWALDDKLKDVKSPELRAALRRLGSPIDDKLIPQLMTQLTQTQPATPTTGQNTHQTECRGQPVIGNGTISHNGNRWIIAEGTVRAKDSPGKSPAPMAK